MTVGVDPLLDTLFRSTRTAEASQTNEEAAVRPPGEKAALGSDAPVRIEGTRSRAGNSMARTRTALINGARKVVTAQGTRLSMSQVAAGAGVAKATLYNHFRTREAVLDALLTEEVTSLTTAAADLPLTEALTYVASQLSSNELRAALARLEPHTLARLTCIDGGGWSAVRQAVQAQLGTAELGQADLVLRWLSSLLLNPLDGADIAAAVNALLAGVAPSPAAGTASTANGGGHATAIRHSVRL